MISRLTILLILGMTLTRASTLLGCLPADAMPSITSSQHSQALCNAHCADHKQQISFYRPLTSTCACGTESDLPRDDDWSASQWSAGCLQSELSVQRTSAAALTSKRRMESKKWLCDDSHRACRVPGQGSAYECTDITSTTQACGGCALGEYIMSGTYKTPAGQDCTQIKGIAKGHVSCMNSQCIAGACEDGWELIHGTCYKL